MGYLVWRIEQEFHGDTPDYLVASAVLRILNYEDCPLGGVVSTLRLADEQPCQHNNTIYEAIVINTFLVPVHLVVDTPDIIKLTLM